MSTILRLTSEQQAKLRPLAQSIHNDSFMLDDHLREDASLGLIREDLEALLDATMKALKTLRAGR